MLDIDWKKYLLKEPRERTKSLKSHEEAALMVALAGRDDYLPAIRFALKSGFRKREVVNLKKADIDWGNRTIAVIGKGGKASNNSAQYGIARNLVAAAKPPD